MALSVWPTWLLIWCVQAISVRSAVFELWRRHAGNLSALGDTYMVDGLHPEAFGHLVWADVIIYTLKRVRN